MLFRGKADIQLISFYAHPRNLNGGFMYIALSLSVNCIHYELDGNIFLKEISFV